MNLRDACQSTDVLAILLYGLQKLVNPLTLLLAALEKLADILALRPGESNQEFNSLASASCRSVSLFIRSSKLFSIAQS